jgi:myo-inositol catabolism protein IolS
VIRNRIGGSDLHASLISMGGSVPTTGSYGSVSFEDEFRRALRAAFDNGINLFDNAEAYGGGRSESLLAEALGDVRSEILIASKASYEHTRAADLKRSCEASLRRLNTDYIDLYYVHFPNSEVEIAETMGAMMDLKRQGKIRAIGVSNFSLSQLQSACAHGEVDALQSCYSLLWRRYVERELQPYCEQNRISLIAFSPLASGLLSGKYQVDSVFSADDQRARIGETGLVLFQKQWWSKALDVVQQIRPIAARYRRTVPQVALLWLTLRAAVGSVTAGARNVQQVQENLNGVGWEMDTEDLLSIDRISQAFTDQLPNYLHYFLKMVGTNATV